MVLLLSLLLSEADDVTVESELETGAEVEEETAEEVTGAEDAALLRAGPVPSYWNCGL